MNSLPEEMLSHIRSPRLRSASFHLIPIVIGILTGSLPALYAAYVLPFHIRPYFGIPIAGIVSCVTFVATLLVTSLTSKICGLGSDFPVAVRTAVVDLWIVPFLFFARIHSWFAVILWAIVIVELFRLSARVIKPSKEWIASNAIHTLGDLSYQRIDLSWTWDFDSLLSSFQLQFCFYAAISSKFLFAVLAFLIASIALVRRGTRLLLDYPYLKSFNMAARMPMVFCIVTLLLVLVWLPRGGLGNFMGVENSLRPASTHVVNSANAQATTQLVNSVVFPGVLLYPINQKHTRIVAPRLANGEGVGKSDKPYVIPFDGVYWVWRPPNFRPPDTAIVFHGTPAKLGFHTTDLSSLWMEAHQQIGATVDLGCCSAIQVVVENADLLPQTISMELVAGNVETPTGAMQSLGTQPISTSEEKNPDPPFERTLTFSIPNRTSIKNFDELTVRFKLSIWRPGKSAKVAIKQFVLIPRR